MSSPFLWGDRNDLICLESYVFFCFIFNFQNFLEMIDWFLYTYRSTYMFCLELLYSWSDPFPPSEYLSLYHVARGTRNFQAYLIRKRTPHSKNAWKKSIQIEYDERFLDSLYKRCSLGMIRTSIRISLLFHKMYSWPLSGSTIPLSSAHQDRSSR